MVQQRLGWFVLVFRSAIFNFLHYASSVLLLGVALPLLLFPRGVTVILARIWSRWTLFLLRHIVGIDVCVIAPGGFPEAPAVLAMKHQSAWDTIVYASLCPDPIFVLKRELQLIPIYGWFVKKLDMIPIDRAGGVSAYRMMVKKAKRKLEEGHHVIIFPEGTRTTPGQTVPYQPGVVGLYGLGYPVIPVGTNSGLFWGRRSFVKRPGTIGLNFGPALPAGLRKEAFLQELSTRIEGLSESLLVSGVQKEGGERHVKSPIG